MSLRWSSYVARKSPKGAQKRKTAVFRLKLHFAWRKSATKFLCVKTVRDEVVKHSLARSIHAKIIGWDGLFCVKVWRILTHRLSKGRFSSIFAPSTSAVTRIKKIQTTLINPLRAFQWAQYDHRTLFLSPPKGVEKHKVSKIWTINCDNSETVRDPQDVS